MLLDENLKHGSVYLCRYRHGVEGVYYYRFYYFVFRGFEGDHYKFSGGYLYADKAKEAAGHTPTTFSREDITPLVEIIDSNISDFTPKSNDLAFTVFGYSDANPGVDIPPPIKRRIINAPA